ncbi:MAG: PrsW family intramembrane metalloprotease [Gammaproteobacteria bacterium]|nr:PrsW family intramembrane metalloprotease [Gammaproteobacteria bacterium]MDH3430274.1 PrsW family intramembrane metalloprotease [Gammaproteobacteria bacterium]MDH3434374.1 PrsW family intramembrane metalloprotease [Gammaproteobacteria bacterium]
MSTDILIRAPVGLVPVLIFLVVLLYMDSYKLVRLRTVLWVIGAGALMTVLAYFINGALLEWLQIDFKTLSRYVAPLTEELLKGSIIVLLFRLHRIGFLVDSAIMGFAVGSGFAFVENLYYLQSAGDAHVAVWVVRGFGTAIMHGGVTAIFAIMSQALTERHMKINPLLYVPGMFVAVTLHSAFNHFWLQPMQMTLFILLLLPPILYVVFRRSAAHLHEWLELDFDADAQLLEQINSGDFAASKIGRFLHDLREKFEGPVVVDMLCYLRLYTELALRAKGVLMMRENGLDAPIGERTREKFAEMEYLEGSIGKTGVLAMRPFLHMTRKDLWQLYVLEDRG